jgi:hypothetical protein
VYDIQNAFVSNSFVYTTTTATNSNIQSISFGFGAGFGVQGLSEIETIFLGTDLLGSNNVSWLNSSLVSQANQAFMTVPIANYAYGFPKNPQGNSADIIYSCLDFQKFDIGVISGLSGINPGADYNVDPFVLVHEPLIAAFDRNDYVFRIQNASGIFTTGERILQTSAPLLYSELTVADETGFTVGESIYQGTLPTPTGSATIVDIFPSTNIIKVNNVEGTIATGTAIKSRISAASTNVTNVDPVSETASAKGIVKAGSNSSVLFVKRISFNNTFDVGGMILGTSSGVTADIAQITEDETIRQIGLNANVEANVVTANGSVTALQVTDSGFGYSNGELADYLSEDGTRSGLARLIVSGSGTGAGYWKSSKGFLSADKFIHDSDYYQEYSYEVLSKLPFEKYSEIFKKTMHTAGTRVFGSVILVEEANVVMTVPESNTVQSLYETVQFNSNSSVLANGAITFDNDYANGQLIFSNGEKVIYEAVGGNTAVTPLANAGFYYVAEANTTSVKLRTNPRVIQQYFNANTDIPAISFTASCTGTALTTVGSPALSVGMSVWSSTGVSLGTIVSGSVNAWVVSVGGSHSSQTMKATNNSISIARNMMLTNDVVRYTTSVGNTAITGLTNNSIYHVIAANSSAVKLAQTRGGAAISIVPGSTSENGHLLAITTINITANSTHSGVSTSGNFITLASEY